MIKESKGFWFIADLLERYGVEVGFVVANAPLVYDILGIFYGRDPQVKFGIYGIICYLSGVVMMALSKYARRWGR